MTVATPEITITCARKKALELVSQGPTLSYPFPHCLSLDDSPGSGIVIFTLENQDFWLAA